MVCRRLFALLGRGVLRWAWPRRHHINPRPTAGLRMRIRHRRRKDFRHRSLIAELPPRTLVPAQRRQRKGFPCKHRHRRQNHSKNKFHVTGLRPEPKNPQGTMSLGRNLTTARRLHTLKLPLDGRDGIGGRDRTRPLHPCGSARSSGRGHRCADGGQQPPRRHAGHCSGRAAASARARRQPRVGCRNRGKGDVWLMNGAGTPRRDLFPIGGRL